VATPVMVRTPLGNSSTYTPGNETATGMLGSSRLGRTDGSALAARTYVLRTRVGFRGWQFAHPCRSEQPL